MCLVWWLLAKASLLSPVTALHTVCTNSQLPPPPPPTQTSETNTKPPPSPLPVPALLLGLLDTRLHCIQYFTSLFYRSSLFSEPRYLVMLSKLMLRAPQFSALRERAVHSLPASFTKEREIFKPGLGYQYKGKIFYCKTEIIPCLKSLSSPRKTVGTGQ